MKEKYTNGGAHPLVIALVGNRKMRGNSTVVTEKKEDIT